MSLLLSQAPAPFNPANGFPYEQSPVPPAHGVAGRCVALALTACSFVAILPGADPSTNPTWLPDYPDQPARATAQPISRKELAEAWPSPQFGTAVRFSGVDPNNGLEITTNLPGPSNFSVSCFIYVPVTPAADSTIWMVQDTHGTTPTNWINVEVTSALDVSVSSNPIGFDIIFNATLNQWYFLSVSVGASGAYTAYWCKVGSPLNTVPGSSTLSTGWTPASFTIGNDYFTEPFDGRITGLKVHNALISSGDAAAEATQIAPVRSANLQQAFKLEHATTKLVDSAYGRNLTAFGAGTWVDEPGPFLQPGNFNPQFGFPYEQYNNPPQRPVDNPLLRSWYAFTPLVAFNPATSPSWLPVIPDRTVRTLPRPVNDGGLFEIPRAGLGAVRFDTAADPLRFTGLPVNNTSYSVMGWVQYDSTTNDDSLIFVDDAAGTGLALEFKTGVLSLVDTFGFTRPASVGSTLVNGRWYFVGLRVNGTAATIFLGSETDAVISSSGTIAAQGGSPKVWFSFNSGNFLIGNLALWELYDAQLSNAEFEAQRLSFTPVRTANLSANWRFASEADKLVDSFSTNTLVPDSSTGTWQNVRGPTLDKIHVEWLPTFPDFARASPRPVNVGGLSWIGLQQQQVAIDWLPDYPDFARTAPRPVNVGGLSWTNVEREPIVDWLPNYPDFARGAAQPVNQGGQASFDNVDFVRFLSWEPQFADFARAALRAVNTGGQAFFDNFDFVPKLSWAPTFSDFAGRAAPRPVNEGGLFRTHLEYEPTDWFPYYQDMVPAAPRALELREGGATFVNPDFVPKLAWAPTFPDFPGRSAPRPVNTGGQVFWTNLEREPIVDWLPDYPSFLHNPLTPANINRSMFAYVDLDFVPKLAWAPDYPSQIPTKPAAIVQNNVFVQAPSATRLVSLSGSVGFTGSITKQTNYLTAGVLSFSGNIVKQTTKFMAGGLSFLGSLTRQTDRSAAGSLSFSGADTKQTGKAVAGGVSTSGALLKQADKSLSGSLSFTGSLVRLASVILAGTLNLGATLKISTRKSLSGAMSFVGATNKQVNKGIVGTLSFLGDIIVDFIRGTTKRVSIEGSVGFSGSTQRRISRLMIGSLSFVGSPAKAMTRAIAGVVSFVGTVSIRRLLEYAIISTTEFVKKAFASKTQTSQGGSIDSQTQDSSKATINKTDSSNGKIKPGE